MSNNTVFEKLPVSTQDPLMASNTFFKHCKPRFRWALTRTGFSRWLDSKTDDGLIRPAYSHAGTDYFSTRQVWQIRELCDENRWRQEPAIDAEFENLLRSIVRIQDFYLPEIRSNQRMGEFRDYRGSVAIGGTYFCNRTEYMLSAIREWRQHNIEQGHFNPTEVLSAIPLDVPALMNWIRRLTVVAESIDPLLKWRMLVDYSRYGKRQDLRFDALLAEDFYEMAKTLKLFVEDVDTETDSGDLADWSDIAPRQHSSNIPQWKIARFGKSLSQPYEMLEFLSNEYDLNPKPRAVVLTEGDEWKAIGKCYTYYGFNPELLGIEFRSISGEGNFSLANWQCFIEYMHEKQILIYFLVDNEGRTVKEARKLLRKKRVFSFPGLNKVVPSRDRIQLWAQSFEESNFTNSEIKRALALQGIVVSSQQVAGFRRNSGKALINALSNQLNVSVDKPRLDVDLMDALMSRRENNPNVKSLRPIERFVRRSGELILLNHQPVSQEVSHANIRTGLLG